MGIELGLMALGTVAGVGSAVADNKNAKKSVDQAEAQRKQSQDYIERMTKQARQDVFKLFPSAQESRQQGLNSSYELYKNLIPVQANLYQQGNMEAQQMLAQGLPQMQNAILGKPVDTNFSPVGLQVPMGKQLSGPPQLQPFENMQTQQQPQPGMEYIQAMRGA